MLVFFGTIIFFLISKGAASYENDTHNRIFKGVPAREGQFPYMVFLLCGLQRKRQTSCSGSLIKFDTILTAAHCLHELIPYYEYRPANLVVVVGMIDTNKYVYFRLKNPMNVKYTSIPETHQESIASKLIMHPVYATDSDYDVGVVKVPKPFVETKFVKTVPYTTDEYTMKTSCYVIGYGKNHLKTTRKLYFFTTRKIKNNMKLCGEDPNPDIYCLKKERLSDPSGCVGDSGGPMLCQGKVYGVYSAAVDYVVIDETIDDCGQLFIDVFAKLSVSERSQGFVTKYATKLDSRATDNGPQLNSFFILLLLFLI